MAVLKGIATRITVFCKCKISLGMGKTETLRFPVEFNKLTTEQAQEKIDAMNDPDQPETTATSILREDILSWKGLLGVDKEEIEFEEGPLNDMLDHIEYTAGLFDAWGQAQLGTQMAKIKNS